MNLVGNAIKFTEHGGVTLRLELMPAGPDRAAPLLAVDVIDTGVGLAPSEHQRIFVAFAQADASLTRRHGGTGLGLTISRELARLLGGDIAVESAPAGGSVFRATIVTGSLEGVRMVDWWPRRCGPRRPRPPGRFRAGSSRCAAACCWPRTGRTTRR